MRIAILFYHLEKKFGIASRKYAYYYLLRLISYLCRKIITSWVFEFIALLVIIANSVVLAL